MIPRTRPVLAPKQEKPAVEMEQVEVTDMDFFFAGGPPLMVTLFPGDVIDLRDEKAQIQWASGALTNVHFDRLLYQEIRPRTVTRPKKA